MPVVSKGQAVERMTRQVEQYDPLELLEVHNELFPNEQRTEVEVRQDPTPLVKRVVDHISGRGIDELVEMWGFIFPARYRNIWYEEEEDGIRRKQQAHGRRRRTSALDVLALRLEETGFSRRINPSVLADWPPAGSGAARPPTSARK